MSPKNINLAPRSYPPALSVSQVKQAGVALISALLMLGVLILLGVTGLQMTGLQEKMTGNQKLFTKAQFAAERGISEGIEGLIDQTISDVGSETDIDWSASGSASGLFFGHRG